MKTINMLQSDIDALTEKKRILNQRAAEDRRALTDSESELIHDITDHCKDLQEQINQMPANKPLTLQGPQAVSTNRNTPQTVNRGLRSPTDRKDYQSLFGTGGHRWTDQNTSFFQAVFGGRYHPDLKNAMTESVPSDGGFLVPTEYSAKIHNVSLENELVLPRAFVQPMQSNSIKIPAMSIGDHSTALMGGFTASYTAETGTIDENSPKTRQMTLVAKKLTGLLRFSAELAEDIPGGENQIVQLCGKGLSWYRDKAFLKGSGAGEPLGVMNSPCLIEVDKEVGQDDNTIQFENLTAMMARMFSGSFPNSVWVCHQSTIPQLLQLSIQVGLGGERYPAMKESNGQFSMLTRPVVFTEKTEPLGTKGDIMLADFSQYVVGLRGQMRLDTSIHVHFQTDELLARLVERHDGQPLWDQALVLEDGTTTVSPFIVLGAR